MKELDTLRQISATIDNPDNSLAATLESVVHLLPTAFTDPDRTTARIRYDGIDASTDSGSCAAPDHSHIVPISDDTDLEIQIATDGTEQEVLDEEIALIETVAVLLQQYVERSKNVSELERTKDVLLHAERLGKTGAWEFNLETGSMYWTKGAKRIHGLQDGNIDSVDEIYEVIHPDHRERVRETIETAIEQGTVGEVTAPIIRPDGTERTLHIEAEIETDASDRLLRGFIQDITTRQERNRELREAKNRLDVALSEAKAGIWEWNLETDELFWSDELLDLLGLTREEFDRKFQTFDSLLHPDDSEAVNAALETALETGKPYRVEQRIRNASGEYLWFDVRGLVLANADPRRMVGIGIDITDRKEQEFQLQRQRDRLEEFASVVSHDLRNPLNVITGRLALAKEDCESPHLDSIERSATRMEELIEDLLTLARRGEQVNSMDPVDLPHVITNCWGNVSTTRASIAVETDQTILADQNRLQQLFENLFRNAIQHGGADVTVTVGSLADGFFVEDDGVGIPAAKRERVFETGYSTGSEGTGFGLSIVQQIVHAHGWEIRATEGSDGGARFEITNVDRAQ